MTLVCVTLLSIYRINLTCKVEHGGVSHRDNLSYLKHQENMDSVQANLQFPVSNRYDTLTIHVYIHVCTSVEVFCSQTTLSPLPFSLPLSCLSSFPFPPPPPPPSLSLSLSLSLPPRDKGCVARLNFSDAESSLGTSGQLSGLMEDSVGASLLSHSQVRVYYPALECHWLLVHSSHILREVYSCSCIYVVYMQIRNLEQSGRAGQSFEVFHDSWRSQSQNASHGGRTSAFQPVSRQQGAKYFGKPLERK